MNSEMGFSCGALASDIAYLGMIRGELAIAAHLHVANLYAVGPLDPDHDASCASAAKLRAAGPFSWSASVPCSSYGSRHLGSLNSAVREKPARAPNGVEWYARSVSPFSPLDVRRRPPVSRRW